MGVTDERQNRTSGESVRVLLVGDPEPLDALADLIDRTFDDAAVVRESSAEGGRARLDRESFDCIVVTDDLPETSCESFLETVIDRHPELPVVVVTDAERVARRTVDAGATDVIRGLDAMPAELVRRRIEYALDAPADRERSGDGEDVTGDGVDSTSGELRRRERELEQYEATARAASDVILTIDDDSVIRNVNPAAEDVFGYDPEELIGESLTTLMPDELIDRHYESLRRYLRTGERTLDWDYVELPGVRADGTEVPLAVSFSEYVHDGEHFFTGIIRDISGRKERERALQEREERLERYKQYTDDVLDAVDDVFYVLDRAGNLRRWNESLVEVTGYTDDEIESMRAPDFFEEGEREKIANAVEAAFETGTARVESEFLTKAGERIPYEFVAATLDSPEGEPVLAGIGRDITERRERERTLRERETALRQMHHVVAETDTSFESKVESLLTLGKELLDTKYAGLSNVEDGEYRFVAVRAPDGAFEAGDTLPLSETYCERVVSEQQHLNFGNVLEERPDLTDRGGFSEMGTKCYLGAPVTADDEFFGTLCFFGPESKERTFDEWEITLVDLMSQWVSYELTRREHERDLRDQREHLAAINRLNRVIRNLNEALVETTSRETLEQVVCDHLVETDRYSFAWIGGVDRYQTNITPRAWAGDAGDYLEDVTITVDDTETGRGPAGSALKTGEVQISQSIESDPQFEPWREAARERGFASSASIPITHEGTTYGVLNVYADTENAFDERQRQILRQLGSIVGHAISALERKRALLSDTTVELEFALGEVPESLAPIVDSGTDGIEIERSIPLGNDRYVYFFRVGEDPDRRLQRAFERIDGVESVRYLDEDRDRSTIEVTIDEPPLTTALSAHDGRLRRATIDDNGFRIVAELPREGDVRSLLESIRESFPDAQVLAQRTVSADEQTSNRLRTAIEDRLTDRQRVVLETAYFAGFYDWPRTTTGEQLAERLDISPATFTQHLRIAERKLLAELFEGGNADRA